MDRHAGAIVLSDADTTYDDLKDWLHNYYKIDDEAECLSEHLTAAVLIDGARQYATGLFGLSVEFDSEWSAEHSAEAVYEYMQDRGEPVTKGRTSVSLGMIVESTAMKAKVGSPTSRSQRSTSTPLRTRTEHILTKD